MRQEAAFGFEVVEGVARLIDHLRLFKTQFIGLPKQVNQSSEAHFVCGDVTVGVKENISDPPKFDED